MNLKYRLINPKKDAMLPAQPLLLASMLLSVSGIPVNGGTQVRADDPMAAHLASLSVGFSGACSGVIVGEDTILTAAHCSDINSVSFGVDRYQPVASAQVEKVVVNPGYVEDGTDRNDIAWVKLASKIPGAFSPAILPDHAALLIHPGSAFQSYGYGQGGPEGTLATIGLSIEGISPAGREIQAEQSAARGLCYGDSGGPSFLKAEDGSSVLIALTSRVENSDCSGHATLTLVEPYLEWIRALSR